MSTKPFVYQEAFPLAKDETEYYLLSKEHVSVAEFEGQEILKVEPEALTLLAQQAFHDAAFMLRVSHQKQVASILLDPEASENDKYVALQFLRNSEIAAKGVLPTCQDTGTAIIMGKKGQRVWTGGGDEAALARGVYNTYTEDNLRYSQNARWICTKRSTPGLTCRRRSISIALTATSTNFCAWRKAAAQPTKPICIRKPKR
jgi:fumarate hydratase class I